MDRPEWVLVGLVLSVGLIGVVVPAGAGSAHAVHAPAAAEPIDPAGSSISDLATGASEGETGAPLQLPAQQDRFPAPAQQEFERSSFRVRVDADGDARWLFRYSRPIDSDDERAAFQRYAERFRTEETAFFRDFRNRSASLTAAGTAETGREMEARNVTRDAGIEQTPTQEEGYVELAFEWTNFGSVQGDAVIVGDVFEGGLYLGASQTLTFVAGDGVAFESVEPAGSPSNGTLETSRSVSWTGERQFPDRRPRVVFGILGAGGGGSDEGASMLWLLGGGVIGLILVTFLVRTRYGGLPGGDHDEPGAIAPGSADASASDADDVGEPASEADEAAGTPPAQPVPDDELVTEILEDSGGRMKQTAIVEETEWSKSKVSMLLSEMEEDGRIKKIQIGRENIIALDGHEPSAASSPFDDAE
jgi:hypothetical protein